MDSQINNFRYDKDKLDREKERVPKSESTRWSVLRKVSKALDTEYVVRYTFKLTFHTNQNIHNLRKALDAVCNRWKQKFGFRPLYLVSDLTHLGFTYTFILFVSEPTKLLQFKSQFIDDIIDAVFLPTDETAPIP
jgi:hypothetical protein